MLIAMALTLILVYAIAQFYAIIGDAVKDGRGMIEMNQQLRAVTQRLQLDLNQITVPAVPWADEGGAAGYLEIREGPASDWDVNQNGRPDVDYDVFNSVDINGLNGPDWSEPNVSNLLGDWDDWLGMTIRSGSLPFTGLVPQVHPLPVGSPLAPAGEVSGVHDGEVVSPNNVGGNYTLLKSSNAPLTQSTTSLYAEVVWWTGFSDLNNNGTWGLDEPRTIQRRQLLIRPDLNRSYPGDLSVPATFTYLFRIPIPSGANLNSPDSIYIYDMFQYCDISMRPELTAGGYLYFKANSLADLCRRQNRFMHMWAFAESTPGASFPYPLDLNPGKSGSLNPDLVPDNAASLANTLPRHAAPLNASSQYRWVLFDGGRKGEDVMLSNVLAFDIRVFDPEAIVRSAITTNAAMGVAAPPINGTQLSAEPIQPGDAGYLYAVANQFTSTYAPYPALGTGAYVDIGYGYALQNALPFLSNPHAVSGNAAAAGFGNVPKSFALLFTNTPTVSTLSPLLGSSRFAGLPGAPTSYYTSGYANMVVPAAYNNFIGFTWDSWTLAYERDGINQDGDTDPSTGLPAYDDANDGLDNDGVNGVDDLGERETAPPYNYPLRGIQIRIRLYEPGTRQVRQATIENDFISE
jgi:hypothetical protein